MSQFFRHTMPLAGRTCRGIGNAAGGKYDSVSRIEIPFSLYAADLFIVSLNAVGIRIVCPHIAGIRLNPDGAFP